MNALKGSCIRGMLLAVSVVLTLAISGGCKEEKTVTDNGDGGGGGKGKKKDYILYATKEDDFHLRLKIDAGKKEARATFYDSDNKETAPIDDEAITLTIPNGKAVQVTLKPKRAKSDPKGKCSVFVGSDDRLGKEINHKKTEIRATVAGKQRIFTLDTDH